MNTKEYIQKHPLWKDHSEPIVLLLHQLPLEEHIKWGAPCYTSNGKNIVGLAAFKNHCAIWFHQGSLLEDPENILINAQPGKTKMLRQVRFRESELPNIKILKDYFERAIKLAQ